MKTVKFLLFIFLAFGFFSFLVADSSEYKTVYASESLIDYRDKSGPKISYDRIDEVKKKCKSVLSSASELKLEELTWTRRKTKNKLSFQYGDWIQDSGDSPILPFESTNSSSKPLNLVSFRVTDLDFQHRTKKYIGVNGVLLLAITTFDELPNSRSYWNKNTEFEFRQRYTHLQISFQGIYTEINEKERVLCMLGETMLPSRESNPPWKWIKDHEAPPLLQDDQILLILRYPKSFTLMTRMIQGELRTLNPKPNLKYFDKINLVSQLGKSSDYNFISDELVSRACDPSKNQTLIDVYKGKGFCDLLQRVTNRSPLMVIPNWKCNGTDEYCSKLGPFVTDEDVKSTDGSFKDVNLYMQNVHCEESESNVVTKVSAVFRVVKPNENLYMSGMRSGLDNMTVTAEGIWKPSSGQLCMVGCRFGSCNTQVCLYIPTSFSIKQRSILVGTFSCLKNLSSCFFPLSFEKLVEPMEMQNYFQGSVLRPVYSYSKLDQAGIILERNQEFSLTTIIKKSVLKFPKLEDSDGFLPSLSLLAEDLAFHSPVFVDKRFSGNNIGLDVLSLGSLFGVFWRNLNASIVDETSPYRTKAEYTEKQLLMNVSAQISLTGESFGNFSTLSLEGFYDENTGKMYQVGCRDVRASWKILLDSSDLESGLDCLIDVVVTYPSTKSRWLADPTAKVSISSGRPEDDPLYFEPVKLTTTPLYYRKQREDVLSRAGVEGLLRVLILTFSVGFISSQLRSNTDSLPFISLVMLGVQALGYSLPLITGAEALFKRKTAATYQTSTYDLERNNWFNLIDYIVKLLIMVCFLLTLRLCQKVWKSRAKTPQKVPNDQPVLVVSLILHALGYILALILHPTRSENYTPAAASWWQTETEEYIGLVQDFFLLPQVIANFIWKIESKMALRKLYYIGITLVRIFPHVYDYMVGSVPDPYFIGEEHELVNPNLDFFSKFGDIAIPVTGIILAVIVFVQQRWNLNFGRIKNLASSSVKYEKVLSESEMVSRVSGNGNISDEE